MSIFQEFGRYYEDDEGQPVDRDERPRTDVQVIDRPFREYDKKKADKDLPPMPVYMIPMMDDKGNALKDRKGNIRFHRRMAFHGSGRTAFRRWRWTLTSPGLFIPTSSRYFDASFSDRLLSI